MSENITFNYRLNILKHIITLTDDTLVYIYDGHGLKSTQCWPHHTQLFPFGPVTAICLTQVLGRANIITVTLSASSLIHRPSQWSLQTARGRKTLNIVLATLSEIVSKKQLSSPAKDPRREDSWSEIWVSSYHSIPNLNCLLTTINFLYLFFLFSCLHFEDFSCLGIETSLFESGSRLRPHVPKLYLEKWSWNQSPYFHGLHVRHWSRYWFKLIITDIQISKPFLVKSNELFVTTLSVFPFLLRHFLSLFSEHDAFDLWNAEQSRRRNERTGGRRWNVRNSKRNTVYVNEQYHRY